MSIIIVLLGRYQCKHMSSDFEAGALSHRRRKQKLFVGVRISGPSVAFCAIELGTQLQFVAGHA